MAGCEPVGTQILVELLSSQEALGTRLHVEGKSNVGAPQAYVLKIGPHVYGEGKEGQIKVGQRILLSGNYTPVPEYPRDNERLLGLVEPHAVKAILFEQSSLEL